jgi:hypothetical protein
MQEERLLETALRLGPFSEQGVAAFDERERPGRAGVTRPPLQVVEARLCHLPSLGVERRFDRYQHETDEGEPQVPGRRWRRHRTP